MAVDPRVAIQEQWSNAVNAAQLAHEAAVKDDNAQFAVDLEAHDTEIAAKNAELQDAVAAKVSTFDAFEVKVKPAVDAYTAAVEKANGERDAALAKLPPQPDPALIVP